MGADPTVAVIIAVLGALALVMAPIGAGLITRGGQAVPVPTTSTDDAMERLRDDLARLRDTIAGLRSDLADERDHVTDERRRHAVTAHDLDVAVRDLGELRDLLDAMTRKGRP